jgi:hypothetical protein
MKITARSLGPAIAGLALAGLATAAHAQGAPAPIGVWSTANGSEQLTVTQTGACALTAPGRGVISGSCSWRASAQGGILTIMSAQNYQPAPIYFNVVWVNQNTISVDNDVFYRRGN